MLYNTFYKIKIYYIKHNNYFLKIKRGIKWGKNGGKKR